MKQVFRLRNEYWKVKLVESLYFKIVKTEWKEEK